MLLHQFPNQTFSDHFTQVTNFRPFPPDFTQPTTVAESDNMLTLFYFHLVAVFAAFTTPSNTMCFLAILHLLLLHC